MRFRANTGPTVGDEAVLRFFHGIVFEPLTSIVKLTSWLGSVFFVGPASVAYARWMVRRSRADAFQLPLAGLGASFVHLFLKILVPRPRPHLFAALVKAPGEGTFPSGHGVNITAFTVAAAFVAARYWPERTRTIAIVSTIVIAWVCATRLYLQVHWPSDVVSGVVIGATWALFLEVVLHKESGRKLA
jgi:undecaprenyl-diphosphatase